MALLLLMLVAACPPGVSGAMEEKEMSDSVVWCVCYQPLNTSKHSQCRLEGTDCHKNPDLWEKTTAGRPKNCTRGSEIQDLQTVNVLLKDDIPACGGDNTTIRPIANEISFTLAITVLTSSAGMLILILFSVGVLSAILKKWKNKRIFEKQKRWDNFLFNSQAEDYQHEAIYSNVINLAAQKEDDFVIYANVPRFQCPRKISPVVA